MPKRRQTKRPLQLRAIEAGWAMTQRLCAKATQNPVDACAVLAAVAISMIIIVNAAFLQSAGHPAPYVANANAKPQAAVTTTTTVAVRPIVAPGAPPAVVPQQMAMRHADPIADLIGPSPRIAAAQKVLSDYGYGQIKPTGSLDDATSAAIEKFEREHKLPVTGRVSDRLMSGLASLAGHPIE